MISKYKVRPWQASALKSFETKIHNGESSNFLCVATPGPESKPLPVEEDNKLPKKDTTKTITKSTAIKNEDPSIKPIGSATEEPEKKKGLLKRLLKKKND